MPSRRCHVACAPRSRSTTWRTTRFATRPRRWVSARTPSRHSSRRVWPVCERNSEMNDWPVDGKLDQRLRRLVNEELAAARKDAAALPTRPTTIRTKGLGAFAGLGALAVIATIAVLLLRSVPTNQIGGADESESPGSSGALVNASPSAPAASSSSPANSETPAGTQTPAPSTAVGPGTFSSTGKMVSTDNGMATLLLDSRVLIVGGAATSPELYDPKTGKFSQTGAALRDGNFASATRLLDGRVLFAGGNDSHTTFDTAQLYDPKTGKFSATGSLITGRIGQTATLLPDGRALIAGRETFNN